MAEALAAVGLASAIVQFVQFGGTVLNRLNEFKHDTKDVPETLSQIKMQLPLLMDTLDRVQKQIDSRRPSQTTENSLKPLVIGCFKQAMQLKEILDKILPTEGATTWQRRVQALKSLAHDKRIQQISTALDGHIQFLNFYQTTKAVDLLYNRDPANSSLASVLPVASKPIFMVPFARDTSFIGRSDILRNISTKANEAKRRVAIAGIGGVGLALLPTTKSSCR